MVYILAIIDDIKPGNKVYIKDREGVFIEYTIHNTIPESLVAVPFKRTKRGNFKSFKIRFNDDATEYPTAFEEDEDKVVISKNGIYDLYTTKSRDPGLVINNDVPRGPVPSLVINNDVPRGPAPRGPAPSFVIGNDSDPSPVTRSDSDPRPVNHVGGKKSRRRVRRRKNRRTRSRK